MSPTERIAQTFPDIDSQGLNTSGTAAGVRSFPQPFVGIASGGVDILIQNGVVNIPLLTNSTFTAIGTSVDVARSFIQYRGCNEPWRSSRVSLGLLVVVVRSPWMLTRKS